MAAYFVTDLTVRDAQKLEQYEHDVLISSASTAAALAVEGSTCEA